MLNISRMLIATVVMLLSTVAFGQTDFSSRMAKMKKADAKVEAYVKANINSPVPQAVLDQYELASAENEDHHHHDHSHIDKEESIKTIHSYYLRQQFLRENPEVAAVYKAEAIGGCENGDFEDGNFSTYTLDFSHDQIPGGGYYSGNCALDPTTINFLPDTGNPDNFQIVTAGADPWVPISMTQNGVGTAVRINSFEPITPILGNNSCRSSRGINRLSKTVTLQQTSESVEFGYAFVLENPNNHDNEQPIFMARAIDANGVELDRVCKSAAAVNDPFIVKQGPFSNMNCTSGSQDSLTYQDWQCGVLEIGGQIGDQVTIEFYVSDCGHSAHFGYAYVDNICGPCQEDTCTQTGSLKLNPTDSCFNGRSINVCGSYELPVINCIPGTYQSVNITLVQNGNQIPITVPASQISVNTAWRTFCITLLPGDFPSMTNGGYDFLVEMAFNVGGGVHVENDVQTNFGLNNDVVFNCEPVCCKGRPIENGNFSNGNQGFGSDYTFQPGAPGALVLPGQYAILNSAQALMVSPTWNVNCTPGGNHLLVNGRTGQRGSRTIWSKTFQAESTGNHSFCVDLKNLPQPGFDVKPVISIIFGGAVNANNITNQVINVTDNGQCKWRTLSRNFEVTGRTFTVSIVLDETGQGDGNDLAIDNIRLIKKNQVPASHVQVDVTPFNVNSSAGTFNVSALPVRRLPRSCSYEWKVAELDNNFNEVSGTVVDNPLSWQTHPAANTFVGYVGTSTLSGNNDGLFQLAKRYRITYSRECNCSDKNSSSWIYVPGRDATPTFHQENSNRTTNRDGLNNNQSQTTSVRLYPNPVNKSLNIELEGLQTGTNPIRIYNINGELVKVVNTNRGKMVYTMDTSALPAGVYFVNVPSENGQQNHRFVKE